MRKFIRLKKQNSDLRYYFEDCRKKKLPEIVISDNVNWSRITADNNSLYNLSIDSKLYKNIEQSISDLIEEGLQKGHIDSNRLFAIGIPTCIYVKKRFASRYANKIFDFMDLTSKEV